MIKIEVKSAELTPRNVNTAKGQLQFMEQTAYAHTCDANGNPHSYPERFTLTLPKGQSTPYAPGVYTLAASSVYVARFGRLDLSPRLVPLASGK